MAQMAGHDMNYIAIAGALGAIGRPDERPQPPLNLVGDFGGGGMLLAFGVVCGILEARTLGAGPGRRRGHGRRHRRAHDLHPRDDGDGRLDDERGANMLDTGAHYYEVYECADGKFLSVGSIEPQFYAELLAEDRPGRRPRVRRSRTTRPRGRTLKERLAEVIATKTRDEWAAVFDGTDACVAPILSLGEAPTHPHNVARSTFVERRRHRAAGAGAPLLPHRGRHPAPAGPRRAAHRRGARRMGCRRRRRAAALRAAGAIA